MEGGRGGNRWQGAWGRDAETSRHPRSHVSPPKGKRGRARDTVQYAAIDMYILRQRPASPAPVRWAIGRGGVRRERGAIFTEAPRSLRQSRLNLATQNILLPRAQRASPPLLPVVLRRQKVLQRSTAATYFWEVFWEREREHLHEKGLQEFFPPQTRTRLWVKVPALQSLSYQTMFQTSA